LASPETILGNEDIGPFGLCSSRPLAALGKVGRALAGVAQAQQVAFDRP